MLLSRIRVSKKASNESTEPISTVVAVSILVIISSCSGEFIQPRLEIPSSYLSANYDTNVAFEKIVMNELESLTIALNTAEENAHSTEVELIDYPSTLASVTLPSYQALVAVWIDELTKAANDEDGFENPGMSSPLDEEEGGILGTRLLDEYGLELEQCIQKGSFGAALYNHATTVVKGDLSDEATIDKLVEIHGLDPSFDLTATSAAATYSRRRSNQTTETGTFYDIKNALIRAKAAIKAGETFHKERDLALEDFLFAWEKSNFATVIHYCNATKIQLQQAGDNAEALGNAMHAYAEAVGFAQGFKGISQKLISDTEIDRVLELLLAPVGQAPQSFKFLNDATLLSNLTQIVVELQAIYGFTDEEIISFYVNDPS